MRRRFRLRFRDRLLALWFPSRCLLCGRVVEPDELFCPACWKERPESPEVRRFRLPRAFSVYAPLRYEGGFRKTLHALKFQGEKGLSEPVGQLMASVAEPLPHPDLVTWVPMTPEKKRGRGYDQSELLARAVARALNCPCLPLIGKTRDTATQHELSEKERVKNVKGAYAADSLAKGKTVLLVDDIVTTGSTISECALALYAAGAKDVVGLCAANADKKEGTAP